MKNDLIDRILGLESRIALLEKKISGENIVIANDKQKLLSIKEFLLPVKILNDVHKTLLIAYYIEKITRVTSFNIDDIEKTYRSAKEQIPTNLNDKINKNIGKGFLMEAVEKKNNKKAWELTSLGEKSIEAGLN